MGKTKAFLSPALLEGAESAGKEIDLLSLAFNGNVNSAFFAPLRETIVFFDFPAGSEAASRRERLASEADRWRRSVVA